MNRDFTSLKAASWFVAACLLGAGLLIYLSPDQLTKEQQTHIPQAQHEAFLAAMDSAQAKEEGYRDTAATTRTEQAQR